MSSIIFVRNGVIKVFLSSSYQAETNSRPSKNTLDQSTLRRCRSLLRRSRSVQLRLCGAPHNRRVTNGFRSEWGAKVYADLCSIVATGRLAGRSALAALRDALPVIAPEPTAAGSGG
jgi:hypothetical protein